MARKVTLGFESKEWHAGTHPQWMSEVGDVMSAANSNEFDANGFGVFTDAGYLGAGNPWTSPGAANGDAVQLVFTTTPTAPVYARCYAMMAGARSLLDDKLYGIMEVANSVSNSGISIAMRKNGANPGFDIYVETDSSHTAVRTFVPMAISVDTYYRVEIMAAFTSGASPGTNSWEVRIDGVSVASGSNLYMSAAPNRLDLGQGSMNEGRYGALDYDDVALNDSSGATFNSWCGPGKIWYLTPLADNARGTNWLAGAGGTTGLWDAVNQPGPLGLATPTNTSQIKNAAMDTAGVYDALLPTYTAAGIPSDHTISFCQVLCRGSGSGTGMGLGVQCVNNPVIAETTIASLPVVVNEPSAAGWTTFRSAMAVSPSLALGTAPVLRIRKTVSSTTAVYADTLWLVVETIPPVPPKAPPPRVISQAVERASVWMKRHDRIYVPRLWTPADGPCSEPVIA